MFNQNDFVRLLKEAWKAGLPLAHNWSRNPWPDEAESIRSWCTTRGIAWGAPSGFPVQNAQRIERGQSRPRLVAFQEPNGHRRIMFSLSRAEDPAAFEAAASFAARHGFERLVP